MERVEIPKVSFSRHRLENGLEVLLAPDREVPLVHVSLHYRVGSSCEPQGLSGFAHLFEHMMFQGSENVPKNEHGRHVDRAGGRWNASTNKDRTNYFETLPSHFLDLGLWLEADRMRALQVTEEAFRNQRDTVIEEKKQSYDNRPYGSSHLRFDELAYRNWAYAHPIIGSEDDLRAAGIEDAQAFHRRWYGPGNAVLVLAGDIREKQALESVRRNFADIEDFTDPQPPDLSEPPQDEEKMEAMTDALAPLPAISLGYHSDPLGSPDYYALGLLSLILTDGHSSRLYRRLVHLRNRVTTVYVGSNQHKGPQLLRIWCQVQDGQDLDTVLAELEEELTRLVEEGVSKSEIEKARRKLAARFVSRLETRTRVGELLAFYAVYYDDPGMIHRELEHFLRVDRNQLQETAARILRKKNRTLLIVQPRKS
ncbi:MAG TPA: pitrilysin family protein [Acidobacteriota bacterium]|nr:pitrilysin family protein [Acidobacteriota bacterium]